MIVTKADVLGFRLRELADIYELMAFSIREIASNVDLNSRIDETELRSMEGSADVNKRLHLRDLVKR